MKDAKSTERWESTPEDMTRSFGSLWSPQEGFVAHGSTRPVHAGVTVPVTASGLY